MHKRMSSIDAQNRNIDRRIESKQGTSGSPLTAIFGNFIGADADDPDLSTIQLLGSPEEIQKVPKLTSDTLTVGDTLILVKGGPIPLTVLSVFRGNIEL